jgi:UDP-GlcNAc:undecaprenyl-phosphate GlcNAc-1-phosphate transferase
LGGVAIAGSFFLIVSLGASFFTPVAKSFESWNLSLLPLLSSCAVILLTGVLDDIRGLTPWGKFAGQVIAGVLLFTAGFQIHGISNPLTGGTIAFGSFDLPLTVLWIVCIINAFNIVDGMDGLAAGVAFVATCSVFVVSLILGNVVVSYISVALAGAILGFLRYNFNPASIFLGDSGSLLLGFILSAVSMRGSQKSSTVLAVVAPLFALGVPILEAGISVLRRSLAGSPIWKPDARHMHHQLLRRGLSPRRVAIIFYVCSAVFGLASLLAVNNDAATALVVLTFATVAWLGVQHLGYSEFIEVGRAFKRGVLYQRRIIKNSIHISKAAEELDHQNGIVAIWSALTQLAGALGLDRMMLKAHGTTLVWSNLDPQSPAADPSACWTIRLDLEGRKDRVGELLLSRDLAKEPMHSDLAALVITLTVHLSAALERCSYEEEEFAVASAAVARK